MLDCWLALWVGIGAEGYGNRQGSGFGVWLSVTLLGLGVFFLLWFRVCMSLGLRA